MKRLAFSIVAALALAAPGFAQEGYSPTLPFGTKEYQVTRYPTVSNTPAGYNPYGYYYGPYGVYGVYGPNGYYYRPNAGYPQTSQGTNNYRYRQPNSRPQQHHGDDILPSYRNSSPGYPSLPGY